MGQKLADCVRLNRVALGNLPNIDEKLADPLGANVLQEFADKVSAGDGRAVRSGKPRMPVMSAPSATATDILVRKVPVGRVLTRHPEHSLRDDIAGNLGGAATHTGCLSRDERFADRAVTDCA